MKRIEKKHIILSLAILLVIIIGVTYAYWTAIIEGTGTPMVFETEEYRIVFTDSEFIDGGRIEPGWSYTKTFTVESKSTVDFKYNIVLEELINTFKTEGSLQYKITSTNGYNMNNYKDVPKSAETSEQVLAYNVNISPKDTHTYTLELIYHNKENEDQSIDMGSKLSAKIGIKVGTEAPTLYNILTKGVKYPTVETRNDYSTPVGGETISNETTSGVIYKTANESEYEEGKEIYYFAGNPSDNWVKFAGYYWRIIRTNHDKSVRLLYAGETPDTTSGYIGKSVYNSMGNNTIYVGWKYGTAGSLDNNRTNENSSIIRDSVLEWYNTNIKPIYNSYISYDAIYCNDRSGGGYSSSGNMYYAASKRLYSNKKPSYQCGMNESGSLYSDVSDSDKFKEGVGLMTVDEGSFAGGVYGSKSPNTYYYRNSVNDCADLYDDLCSVTGSNAWWTMSPNRFISNNANSNAAPFSVGGSSYSGAFSVYSMTSEIAVRPVLSLNYDTLASGSGTVSDPYVIN